MAIFEKDKSQHEKQAEQLLYFKAMDAAIAFKALGIELTEQQQEVVVQALYEHTLENLNNSTSKTPLSRGLQAFAKVAES